MDIIKIPCIPDDYLEYKIGTIKYKIKVETVQISKFYNLKETEYYVTVTDNCKQYIDEFIIRLDGRKICKNCDKCKYAKGEECTFMDTHIEALCGLAGYPYEKNLDITEVKIPFSKIGYGKPFKVRKATTKE